MTTADIETIVIGAGVVGLATGAALAKSGREVFILEREPTIGQGVSSRNSEVIHAGIYYPQGSLKAKLCVTGRDQLYKYCDSRNIPHQQIGKLIVATNSDESVTLNSIQQKALANGVNDISLLPAKEAMAMQPGLQCSAALHSPSTGIVDSHALMLSLQADIEQHNGIVACHSCVENITVRNGVFIITLTDNTTITSKQLVNCAGLQAVAIAQKIEMLEPSTIPTATYAKGNYFKLATKAPFSQLIYPAPVVGGLGIHLTIDLAGQKRFGPDVEWLDDEPFDYSVDPQRADAFYSAIRKYWPDLPDNALVADYCGIRPKIQRAGVTDIDFEFSTAQHHGIEGLVNLYGIESPGLTSSLAIAAHVRDCLLAK